MPAELLVIQGPLAGNRYALDSAELLIGQAPNCDLIVHDALAGWRHCAVRQINGGYQLLDYRSQGGTFLNGKRVLEAVLSGGDQIRIGDSVFLFSASEGDRQLESTRTTLLRACTLHFVAKAIGAEDDADSRGLFESQFFQVIADVVPIRGGFLVLASTEADLASLAAQRLDNNQELARRIAAQATADGVFSGEGWLVHPMYVHGALAGLLAVQTDPSEEARDILSALTILISAGLESKRDVVQLQTDNALLRERVERDRSGIAGDSPAILRLLDMITRVAPRDTTVLILGESGTGKELVAHAIHQRSNRRQRPFVAINCAALTETLLESELFGHEKGAFTGAVAQKKGKLEMAEGGTVFLDEIGEMAPALQAKLLRVLQQRTFERVGGTRTMRLDVRLIAATNRDLAAEVRRGAFREDLFHRLNVVAVRTPPLRDRKSDIPILARHFLSAAAASCRRRVLDFTAEAEKLMLAYEWPGNVRELENTVERAVVLGQGDYVLPEDLPDEIQDTAVSDSSDLQSTVSSTKRDSILRAWEQAGGDYKVAAQILGLHPNSLLRLVRTLNLRPHLHKFAPERGK
ncbi:MAG: sigma 54-interacting transcriptional regulator [Bryobacterales bacterium]|nr:sigma 54-interacting transcriptional regulator [Bryobacterales bacterium]